RPQRRRDQSADRGGIRDQGTPFCRRWCCAPDGFAGRRSGVGRPGEPLMPRFASDTSNGFGWGQRIQYSLVGDTLLVQRTPQTAQFDEWELSPDERRVNELQSLAEAIAGRHRNADGALVAIAADELTALRRKAMKEQPEAFGPPVTSADDVRARRIDPRTA